MLFVLVPLLALILGSAAYGVFSVMSVLNRHKNNLEYLNRWTDRQGPIVHDLTQNCAGKSALIQLGNDVTVLGLRADTTAAIQDDACARISEAETKLAGLEALAGEISKRLLQSEDNIGELQTEVGTVEAETGALQVAEVLSLFDMESEMDEAKAEVEKVKKSNRAKPARLRSASKKKPKRRSR